MNRISDKEAVQMFHSPGLLPAGLMADRLRQELHPDNTATFIIDRNINYTNICTAHCKFCAFHNDKGYLLSKDALAEKIRETVELGGTQILLQGGLHPGLPLEFYEDMMGFIRENFKIHVHAFSPPEICNISNISGLGIKEVIKRLKDSGLDSIPGGGAEILVDSVRAGVSPNKCTVSEWLEVMRTAHKAGLRTTATMMFGFTETVEDRVEHLEKIRLLQDETGGFTSFIPWTFQPGNTRMSYLRTAGGVDYLKTLAIARVFLDNIPNIQASWVTQGNKVAQAALRFGANDIGSTMIEENVVSATGVSFEVTKEELIGLIANAGFTPARRDSSVDFAPRQVF
ncbi:MAG: dehypoxanthine futalosine cyclase [Planctomycetes bacterium]|nr:dehypoxanthine futalosine cyclase [Planctomycetota bacterium]